MQLASQSPDRWQQTLSGRTLEASSIEVLTSTAEYRDRLFQLIASATRRIHIAALYLQNDDAGRAIMEALYEAKKRTPDLDVRVLVDFHRAQRGLIGKGPQVGNDQFYREVAQKYAPVQIELYGVPVKSREWAGVLHLKGFVIDDTVVYSGASINDVYLQWQERYRYDRYHLIHDPVLSDSLSNFMLEDLIGSEAVVSLLDTPIPSVKALRRSIKQLKMRLSRASYALPEDNGTGSVTVFPLIGLGRQSNQLNRTIIDMLKGARSSVFICTPYFNLPSQLSSVIGRLLKRGVRVQIVVGDKTANDFYMPPEQGFSSVGALPYLYEQNLKRFAKRYQGAIDHGLLDLQLWFDNSNSFHLKGIQVDDRHYLLTGNNLNPRAWALDLENGLLLQDNRGQLKAKFERERQTILQHTTRLNNHQELESLNEYPAQVTRLLKRLQRVRADLLLKRML
ncbi:CDP-diacylglycerol--serine O-phosphatidyltransferase [Ferrimonas gelatinilytica]|uniref:CDP-diacylglycerol--serine O-phosphatidyltransferase n=1 Tax=Ferrimonas gelatinilytica TaxID=1255257 RepID=A0ABP9RWW3_9GAMM